MENMINFVTTGFSYFIKVLFLNNVFRCIIKDNRATLYINKNSKARQMYKVNLNFGLIKKKNITLVDRENKYVTLCYTIDKFISEKHLKNSFVLSDPERPEMDMNRQSFVEFFSMIVLNFPL